MRCLVEKSSGSSGAMTPRGTAVPLEADELNFLSRQFEGAQHGSVRNLLEIIQSIGINFSSFASTL